VAVSLDPDTAHPDLILSESGRHVSPKEKVAQDCDASRQQEQGKSESILSVLGQNCFTTGKYYWEVKVNIGTEVGPTSRWALGVCSDTVKRDGWFKEIPAKNFWLVACEEGKIVALDTNSKLLPLREFPHRIGVFLDWEAGDVSFYNMVDGSHIYSFARIIFCGALRPYFSLQGAGKSVTICLASDHTENCPDCSQKSSVTRLMSHDTDIPQESKPLLSFKGSEV
jgi:hypothetical protein